MPGGEMPGGGMPGGSQPGEQSGGQSGDPQGADGSGSAGSAGDGQSVEDLDKALDDSLDGFDDAVGGSGKGTSEIDILSPSGSTGMENNSDEPLFEEGSEGGMAEANAELEKRAAEGSGEGSDGAEAQMALKALRARMELRALNQRAAKSRVKTVGVQQALRGHRAKLCQSPRI